MGTSRLEAFSDGVIAIIITIMVLELKVPEGAGWDDIVATIPLFLSYVLSFIYVGIYWNNHHHLLHAVTSVTGPVMWANLHLLFWLSLVPFATAWMDESHLSTAPVALYGMVLFMCATAFTILTALLVRSEGSDSSIARAVRRDVKSKGSLVLYAVAIALAFIQPWCAVLLYVCGAVLWFIPDRRIERVLNG